MLDIILIIMPIFLVILLGNILRKYHLMNDEFIKTSNILVLNVFLPIMLFYKISQSDFSEVFSGKHILIMLASIFLMFIISFPLAKLLRLPRPAIGTFVSNNFRTNVVIVGLPICFFIFGDPGFAFASILVAFVIPLNNILGVIAFSSSNIKSVELKKIIKSTFLNPLIIGCLTGILFSTLHVRLPEFLQSTISILSGITLPLALLGIGANTSLQHLKGNTRIIAISTVMKLFCLPLIALLLFRLTNIVSFGLIEKVIIVLLASPSAQINFVLASAMDGDADMAIGGIITTTILSALSFIIWLNLLGISPVA